MKSIRIELTAQDHHALRVAAATADLTMRQFAQATLLRAIRGTGPSRPGQAADWSGQPDDRAAGPNHDVSR